MGKEELQSLNNDSKNVQIVSGTNTTPSAVTLKPLGLRSRAVFRQVLMVVLANMSNLSPGMSLGFPAVTLPQLTNPSGPYAFTISQASWFASINAIACPLGGLLSGYLLDKFGRKPTIFVINFTGIISWALSATSSIYSDVGSMFIQIMISRFLIGITTGLASSPAGVYSAEICHPSLRGRLTLGTSLATAGGILAIYVLGYFIRDDFQLISIIACGYAIVTVLLTIQIPESPSWLMSKGRTEESRKILRYFRGIKKTDNQTYEEFDTEFSVLQKSLQIAEGTKTPPFRKMLKKPEVFKPLLIMIGFFGFQQFSGIFVVVVYAVQFSIEAGVTIDPILCAIFIGITRILTTFIVGIILDKWGRRPPAMLSGLGMAISMFLLASTTWFPFISVPYLPVICIIIYIFTSTLGLMTLPFSMISEVYPQRVRGAAAGITVCCAYIMSFTIIKLYPAMVENLGNENVFAFYGTVSILAVVYVYFFLPETKGKSLLEIENYFKFSKNSIHKDYQNNNEIQEVLIKT